jgi:hypothetical protein
MYNCYFISQLRKNCTTVKQMHNSKKNDNCKQIYCNTNAEALTRYSLWEFIILLLFALAFMVSKKWKLFVARLSGFWLREIIRKRKYFPQKQKKMEGTNGPDPLIQTYCIIVLDISLNTDHDLNLYLGIAPKTRS